MSNYTLIKFCYFHDSGTAINFPADGVQLFDNIIDTCTTGLVLGGAALGKIVGNVFYNGTTGIFSQFGSPLLVIMNNTFSDYTTALSWSSASFQSYIDYNNYWNNTTDVSNITKGKNALAVNPQFTDAPNGDFSLSASSELINAGIGISLGVG